MPIPISQRPRVVVADDQADVREALRLLLKSEGFEIEAVPSPAALSAALDAREFGASLMDLSYARDSISGQERPRLLEQGMRGASAFAAREDFVAGESSFRHGSSRSPHPAAGTRCPLRPA